MAKRGERWAVHGRIQDWHRRLVCCSNRGSHFGAGRRDIRLSLGITFPPGNGSSTIRATSSSEIRIAALTVRTTITYWPKAPALRVRLPKPFAESTISSRGTTTSRRNWGFHLLLSSYRTSSLPQNFNASTHLTWKQIAYRHCENTSVWAIIDDRV